MSAACPICAGLQQKRSEGLLLDEPHLVAFPHPEPQTPVHIVVATRQHLTGVCDPELKDAEIVGELVLAARRVAEKTGLVERGFRIVLNHGKEAEQEVPHLHLHVLGGRMLRWPPG